jgi:hypothetical protein
MAEATVTSRLDHSLGNLRAVTGRIANLGDTNTWVTGLGTIVWVGITDEAAAAGEDIGCTFSGGTVTFAVESGAPECSVIAIGY